MMSQRIMQIAVRSWIICAAVAVPWRLRSADSNSATRPLHGANEISKLGLASDSTGGLVADAVSAKLFGASGSDAEVPGAGMSAIQTPAAFPTAPAQRVRLSAIVGPPWRAVLEFEGTQKAPLVVEAGDSLLTYRISRISADTVVLKRGGSISRRTIAESWLP